MGEQIIQHPEKQVHNPVKGTVTAKNCSPKPHKTSA